MDWVKERLKQRDEACQNREKLGGGMEPMWKSLRQAIKDSIAEFQKANQYGYFEQNGKNHHVYWVRYLEDAPNRGTQKKKVTIEFDASEAIITVTYEGVDCRPRSLRLACEDDELCFKVNEDALKVEPAAYLLDPFLFPELAKTPLPEQPSEYHYRGLRSV